MYKLLVLFTVEFVYTSNDLLNRKYLTTECDEENRLKADDCADELWFTGRRSRKYPQNHKQMQNHCKQTTTLIKCVENFIHQCGTTEQTKFTNLMLNTIKISDQKYCTEPAKYKEFISMSSCGNAVREKSNGCMDTFLRGLGKANTIEAQLKVPHVCW